MTQRRSTKGFTLIELLVVIAIISLLLSILMPSLQRARDLVRSVQCTSNLRSIYMTVMFYVQDHEGWHPKTYYNSSKHWYLIFQDYSLNHDLPSWWHLNVCPGDDEQKSFGYAINRRLNDPDEFRFLENRPRPATTAYLFDYRRSQVQTMPSLFRTQDPLDQRLRHLGRLNMLYYDGRAEGINDLDDPGLEW